MPNIDRAALLAWVRAHADHPSVLVHAAYTGLADRIEHGQFDTPETPETRGGITGAAVNYKHVISGAEPSATNTQSGPSTTPRQYRRKS